MTMIIRGCLSLLSLLLRNSKWVWFVVFFDHSPFCRRKHNMEELHEVAKEFDLHHLCVGGGGGTGGGTGVRLRVHSQPAMNVSTLHVDYLHFFPPSLSHLSFLLSFLLTFPFPLYYHFSYYCPVVVSTSFSSSPRLKELDGQM